jgi:hypothetical protein
MTKNATPQKEISAWSEMTNAQLALADALQEWDRAIGAARAAEDGDTAKSEEVFQLMDIAKNMRHIYRKALERVTSLSRKFDQADLEEMNRQQREREKSLTETRYEIQRLRAELEAYTQRESETEINIERHKEKMADIRQFLPVRWLAGSPTEIRHFFQSDPRRRVDLKQLFDLMESWDHIELQESPFRTKCTKGMIIWDNMSGPILASHILSTTESERRSLCSFSNNALGRTSAGYIYGSDERWRDCERLSRERHPELFNEISRRCKGRKADQIPEADRAPEPIEEQAPLTVGDAVQKRLEKELSRA